MLSDPKAMLGAVVIPAVLGLAMLTGGCNTISGMGEDVKAAGGAMSSTAEKTEDKIEGAMSEEEDTEMENKDQ